MSLLKPGTLLITCAGTMLISLVLTRLFRTLAQRKHLLDHPNERSSHNVPVPRLGGVAIVVAFLMAAVPTLLLVHASSPAWTVMLATTGIALLGLIDDLRPLPARVRFGIQAMGAIAVVAAAQAHAPGSPWLDFFPGPIRAIALVVWIVWLTNLYNFMDGIDGLAAGQAVIGAVAIACAALLAGAQLTATLALLLGAASVGFLVFNFPPASIFMGDAGSTALGFFFAAVPLLPESHPVPLEAVALALALFLLDATSTLLRRMARGERFFQAHRTHLYQRPVALGVPHRTITLWAWSGMAIVGACAAAYPLASARERGLLAVTALAIFGAAVVAVTQLERGAGRRTLSAK